MNPITPSIRTQDFSLALAHLVSYLGNYILPIFAGLTLCIGVYQLAHKARAGERYITAALACLLASGFCRLAEHFGASGDPGIALLALTNWVANVILPIYAGINLLRAILSLPSGGFMEFTSVQGNTGRHLLVAVACISISSGLRLLEWFVTTGAGGLH